MNSSRFQHLLLVSLFVSAGLAASAVAPAATEWKPGVPRTAYVTLLEWNWDNIAKECTAHLGPKGYAAVQVSPPQEHGVGGEWWRRYQPVSYQLISRGGNRTQFKAMVDTCKAAGVDVYVDTVINHMAGGVTGTGTAGTSYGNYVFPTVPYGASDFHQPSCSIAAADYTTASRRANVLKCDLPGLPDLNTGLTSVQDKIAAYMKDLLSLGVAGFRIDAAKHIAPSELAAIKAKVPGSYFFTQEVIRDASVGSNTSGDMALYQALGTVNEFNYLYAMKNSFLNLYGFNLSRLPEEFSTWGFMDSAKATVFVNNHDTERKLCTVGDVAVDDNTGTYGEGVICDSLNVWNRDKLFLANIFMLAYNYGYPSVASGYNHTSHNQGPTGQPYSGSESIPANCSSNPAAAGKWDCVHRDRRVANMVGFRNYTDGAPLANWVVGTVNQIAFSRTGKGFVAINNTANTWQKTFITGLADGRYCNVTESESPETGLCAGAEHTVSGGQVTLSIAPNKAVALHVGAKVIIPEPDIPSTPGLPVASAITSTGATLKWTASVDNTAVVGYYVKSNGVTLRTTTTNSVTLTGLLPNTSYTFTVVAYDPAANMSMPSPPVTFKTLAQAAKVTVYYYTAWPKAYGYNSKYTSSPGLSLGSACTGYKTRTIDISPLSSAQVQFNNGSGTWDPVKYTVTPGVNIIKNGVVSKGSNPCDVSAPTVPTGVVSSLLQSNRVDLSWTGSSDNIAVVGYRVYRDGVQIGTSAVASYSDATAQPATPYSYTIKAYDAAGNLSGASAALEVNTPALDDGSVTITFKVNATTLEGENVYITGNQPALGNWSTTADTARKCSRLNYPVWDCTVRFASGNIAIAYKYQKLGIATKWESGADRNYTVPAAAAIKDDGSFRN